MRRNIELYINDSLVDLNEDNLILFNYKAEELTKPSIVANSYSQQVSLPMTKNNNQIFGHFKRSDRLTGDGFDAMRKQSFRIMNQSGELLEHGYIKLDEVTDSYKVTLYGGLGSFFYGLSFDESGNKKNLASLDFGGGSTEFDTTINKDTIKRAWIGAKTTAHTAKWKKINFAPCYNGIPTDNFDADKVIVDVTKARTRTDNNNLFPSTIDSQAPYQDKYALMEMEDARNEWIVGDLRSYLQRPVINVQSVLDAISNSSNNGGYTLNWHTSLPMTGTGQTMWVTLKNLSSIDLDKTETRTISIERTTYVSKLEYKSTQEITIFDNLPNGTNETSLNVVPTIQDTRTLYFSGKSGSASNSPVHITGFICQLVGYGTGDTPIAYSPVVIVSNAITGYDMTTIATDLMLGESGEWQGETTQTLESHFENGTLASQIPLSFNGSNITRVVLKAKYKVYTAYTYVGTKQVGLTTSVDAIGTIQPSWGFTPKSGGYSRTTQSSVRSGMQVTKADLLNTDYSPAEFLLSLAKMFHWHFYAEGEKTIGIYGSQITDKTNIFDLSKVIDLTETPTITPVFADARWFSLSNTNYGARGKAYKEKYGLEYGAKKVNTGYEFNTTTTALMDSLVFKGAVQVLENSPLYNDFTNNGGTWLNLFRQKYTLQYGTGDDAKNQDYLPQVAMSLLPYNSASANSDTFGKVQLCDKDQKGESGEGVLLLLQSESNWLQNTREYTISDDNTALFVALNDSKPCWLLDWLTTYTIQAKDLPNFRRFKLDSLTTMSETLDFSLSSEVYDNTITGVLENISVYDKYWRNYLQDRYDVDTRVMKCKVDLSRMKVNTDLFKRFWWYDNTYWVLNKINNYSITTLDSTECEFIKVQDKDNY